MRRKDLGRLHVRSNQTFSYLHKLMFFFSARYQTSMLRALKEVHGDDSIVGFYQCTTFGAFFTHTLVESLATQREKLRRGGVVVVHGELSLFVGPAQMVSLINARKPCWQIFLRQHKATLLSGHFA